MRQRQMLQTVDDGRKALAIGQRRGNFRKVSVLSGQSTFRFILNLKSDCNTLFSAFDNSNKLNLKADCNTIYIILYLKTGEL